MKYIKIYILLISLIQFISSKNFLFTVIISIYNSGRYLEDSIDSILNQTVNFTNIQIILVNDGSTDHSEKISLIYRANFGKNIIYIKINHGGVSRARNIGIIYAKGKYITIL